MSNKVQTNPHQENTKTCSICGKPLERWENEYHLKCYASKKNINDVMRTVGVPQTFMELIRNNKVDLPKSVFLKKLIKGNLQGLFFVGQPGTGKTLVSCYLATHFVRTGKGSAKYLNMPEFFHNIRQSFNNSDPMDVNKYNDIDLLVLDDIGAENTTEWTSEQLYLMVNYRYINNEKTIATTNLPLQQLASRIGDRLVSRLTAMCTKVDLGSTDRRLK